MRWQKTARLAIATFVIVFAGVVLFTMRQRAATPEVTSEIRREDPVAKVENTQGALLEKYEDGKLLYRMRADRHLGYADGRTRLGGVELTLPDRSGRTIDVKADEAVVTAAKGREIGTATFDGNVRLTTSDGIAILTATAVYDDASGMVHVPGGVEFTRGRMRGKGVGASYDRNKDVLWLLAQAHIIVAPDATGGGAADATAGSAGLARADNYLKLVGAARVVSDGRTIVSDELTVRLKPAGETIEGAELRGNSRITETGNAPRNMAASDIDLAYAADGRTLQHARLMEHAVVDLPGSAGAAGRRISGRTIDMAMGPDGSTLTALNASENVQVDLPAAGNTPARQIRAATLHASGADGQGLREATFAGGVEYRETRGAQGKLAAVDRTARSERLALATQPGFGDVERADFRGNFRFTDGSKVTAEAPRGLYHVKDDRVELSPASGERGPRPSVNDGRFLVEARNIHLSPESRRLAADTNVRSTVQPARRGPGTKGDESEARMPALLEQDRPVYVAANRLVYDGIAEATYSGNARLWQDQSKAKIDADTIVLNDRTGNLTARTKVNTSMLLEDADPATKQKKVSQTRAMSNVLVYDDAKRLAVYTGTPSEPARMTGVYGDVTADRIDVYLKEGGGELERAESHGRVTVAEGARTATGDLLIYTSADDTYVMTGNPVEAIERDTPTTCKKTTGTTLTFQRSVGSIRAETNGLVPLKVVPVPCPAEQRD